MDLSYAILGIRMMGWDGLGTWLVWGREGFMNIVGETLRKETTWKTHA
jgi:hypothetical protein